MKNDIDFLTVSETCERLRISRRTLHEHTRKGKLPSVLLGERRRLYHWPTLQALLLRQQSPA